MASTTPSPAPQSAAAPISKPAPKPAKTKESANPILFRDFASI